MTPLDLLGHCEAAYASCAIVAGPDGRDGANVTRLPSGDVVLTFRGTLTQREPATILDWINDMHADLVVADGLPGRVHAGFLASLNDLWPGVFAALESPSLPDTGGQKSPLPWKKSLIVTGHSKGGALAILAAARLLALQPFVMTFAAPMTGDLDFAAHYPDAIDVLRYEAAGDIVPHLPPFGYRAVGNVVREKDLPPSLRRLAADRLVAAWDWRKIAAAHHIAHYRALLEQQPSPRTA